MMAVKEKENTISITPMKARNPDLRYTTNHTMTNMIEKPANAVSYSTKT